MLLDLIANHWVTLFLILLFSIRLLERTTIRNMETKYFWLTVISCFLLVLEDIFEKITATDPSLKFWRILMSVMGYTLRSTAVLGLLLVVVPRNKRTIFHWLPSLFVLLLCGTAFFNNLVFGYGVTYDFFRGPLGYAPFFIPISYMLMILWYTYHQVGSGKRWENYLLEICGIFCLTASFVDAFYGGTRVDEAILISSVFFFNFLYFHDIRKDPLTGLLNRKAFYEDCDALSSSISAVASLDMNGLKKLNDTLGHSAGDKALIEIGKCINEAMGRYSSAYRIGGDEFVVLFLHADEEQIALAIGKIRDAVKACGYSISAGYAMRGEDVPLDEVVKESDRQMYENKERHYRENKLKRFDWTND